MRYVALLRAINVGKANRIRMEELRALFERLGFEDVATLLQTGNVIFTSRKGKEAVTKQIEEALAEHFGKPMTAIVRSADEMKALLKASPFNNSDEDKKHFVTFLREPLKEHLLKSSPKGDTELALQTDTEVFTRLTPSAQPGVGGPNYIESKYKIPTTTRYWSVVRQIVQKLD